LILFNFKNIFLALAFLDHQYSQFVISMLFEKLLKFVLNLHGNGAKKGIPNRKYLAFSVFS